MTYGGSTGMSDVLAGQLRPIPSFTCTTLPKWSINGLSRISVWRPVRHRSSSLVLNVINGSNVSLFSTGTNAIENESGKLILPDVPQGKPVRTLLLDNYDSYTYNLYQLLSVINGVAPVVLRNDEIPWDDLYRLLYKERAFHNVVISPGPGSPTRASDVGLCLQLLQECDDIPILGVCLGHQALGYVHGAHIVHAPEPVHGRLSEIEHTGHPLFAGIPSGVNSGFKVVRYHSLMVDATSLPEDLVPTAWTVVDSGVLGLEDCQDCLGTPHSSFLSERRPSWQVGGSTGDGEGMSNGLPLGFDNVNKVVHNSWATKVLMGVSHRSRPHHGVQFHPESVATTHGQQILENFQRITVKFWEEQLGRHKPEGQKWKNQSPLDLCLHAAAENENIKSMEGPLSAVLTGQDPIGIAHVSAQLSYGESCSTRQDKKWVAGEINPMFKTGPGTGAEHTRLHWKKLPGLASGAGGSRALFCKLFAEETVEDTFWLDSSAPEQGGARFSFMGGRGGSLWQRITYRITHDEMAGSLGGVLKFQNAAGQIRETIVQEGFLDFLNRELELRQCRMEDYASLPFDFCGGFIGYLGYELKVECGAESNRQKSLMPDAGMFLADRMVVIDHSNNDVYVLALFQDGSVPSLLANLKNRPQDSFSSHKGHLSSCPTMVTVSGTVEKLEKNSAVSSLLGEWLDQRDGLINGQAGFAGKAGHCDREAAEAWVEEIVTKVNHLTRQNLHKASEHMHHVSLVSSIQATKENLNPPFIAEKSRTEYIKDVKRCQEFIADGESYEVCLTTRLRRKLAKADCFGLYLMLRETNPAPYSSWMHFGKDGPCICSSSPERFLQLDRNGVLEAKPIKGTVARGSTPVEDERLKYELHHSQKDQAENLMIVDLLRNDLGRVCEPGSIHVPSLMAVESYSTVHTMVSTVRGEKRSDVTPVDCIRAAFPGGSMTGAPKLRTMEIIDSLESSPRGVYSGSIGYLSFNSSFDLNIVIRTLVIHDGEASLGAGGAVISLSDPAAEYEEMVLKTKAPVRAVYKYLKLSNRTDQSGNVLPLGLYKHAPGVGDG